jgi:hypothetical protein
MVSSVVQIDTSGLRREDPASPACDRIQAGHQFRAETYPPAIRSTGHSATQFRELVRAGSKPVMFERFDRVGETAMLAAEKDLR